MSLRTRILVAAPSASVQEIVASLSHDAECVLAHTFEEAARALEGGPYDAIVVGYYFDDARPFRFIRYAHTRVPVPIVLVRALRLSLGSSESDIRASYREVGAVEFVNFLEEADRLGVERARQRLRDTVLAHCQRR